MVPQPFSTLDVGISKGGTMDAALRSRADAGEGFEMISKTPLVNPEPFQVEGHAIVPQVRQVVC